MSEPDSDHDEIDLVRVTLQGEEMHFSVSDVFEEPSSWGSILADVARIVAKNAQDTGGHDQEAVLQAIREVFLHDLDAEE
jgi:hypothetical protein